MLSIPPSARVVVSIILNKDKAKEFADRIADINRQVQRVILILRLQTIQKPLSWGTDNWQD